MKFLDKDTVTAIGKASVVGLHMVSGIIVGAGIGFFLDKWLGTQPWLLLIFFVLGIIAGFLNVWRDLKSILRQNDSNNKAEPE